MYEIDKEGIIEVPAKYIKCECETLDQSLMPDVPLSLFATTVEDTYFYGVAFSVVLNHCAN